MSHIRAARCFVALCLPLVAFRLPTAAVCQTATVTTLTATPTTANVGASISLSAAVGGAASNTASPPGSVTFLDGTTVLGTTALTSSAVASPKIAQLGSAIDSTAAGTLVFADFDGDGKPDALSYSSKAFQVLMSKGGGNYTALAVQTYALSQPAFLDYNHDGKLDIISLGPSGPVSVFAGNGVGVFAAPVTASGITPQPVPSGISGAGNGFTALAAVDLTGTGVRYILVGERLFSGGSLYSIASENAVVSTYRNDGDGTFIYLSSLAVASGDSSYPRSVINIQAADLNADGRLDLLATIDARTYAAPTLAVALGYGDGSFAKTSTTLTGTGSCDTYCGLSVVAGDFAKRGKADIAFTSPVSGISNNYSKDLAVYPGNGDGTFSAPLLSGTVNLYPLNGSQGYFPHIAAVDLDGDGNLDLVDSYGYGYLGRGDFTFTPTKNLIGGDPTYPTGCGNVYNYTCGFTEILPVDFNSDGLQDLYLSRGGILLGQAGTTALLQNLTSLAVGTHSLTARYVPTGVAYSASTSPGVPVTINAYTPSIVATAQPTLALISQAVTLTATITSAGPAPTGNVTFAEGTTTLGSVPVQKQGNANVASVSYTFATAGVHTVTVSYAGDSSNAMASTTATVTSVVGYPTTTTLSASSATLVAGATVTLSANVAQSNPSISVTPTGSVTFFDGTTSLGTSALSNGKATVAVSLIAVGTHSIAATYAGDTSNASSTASALVVNVVTPFSLSTAAGSSTTLSAGYSGSTNTTVSLTPQNGFTGSVAFTCSNLPSGVNCTFSPSTITVTGSGAVTTTLTVSTSSTVGALRPFGLEHGSAIVISGALFLGLASLTRRRKWTAGLALSIAMLPLATIWISGCSSGGGSGSITTTTPVTNPKTVSFNVVASSAGAQVSTAYTLNVQ